jgi:high-affinity K+ transport system ATPase subunit B
MIAKMQQYSIANLIAQYFANIEAMFAKMQGLIDYILSIPAMYKDQMEAKAADSW